MRGEGEYIPIFIPWHLTPEYTSPVPQGFEMSVAEEEYQDKHDLTPGQIYWRRNKIFEGGEQKFRQEYPADPEEAFISSGNHVFAMEKVNDMLAESPVAERAYNDGIYSFIDKREGELKLWNWPKHDDLFVIGADVAGGVGQDYSAAVVMRPNNEIIAMYRSNLIDPGHYGELLFYLGRMFNNALLCVEANNHGVATLNELKRMDYVNLYYETKPKKLSNESGLTPGFRTTGSTKPLIISHLQKAILEESIGVPSKVMIQELKDYVADDTGKTNAIAGSHDDTVIASALCLEVLRTHGDKLANNMVPWSQKTSSFMKIKRSWL